MLASPSQPSPLAVLRNPAFTLLWIAQLISVAGSALTALAASILVYRLTGSALGVGLMLMATALPSLLIGLVTGVFVDRYDRKRIMIAADLIRAALIACIPLLVTSSIVWLYVIVILSSAIGQFFVTRDLAFAIGMAAAGLADVFDVRVLFLIVGVLVFGCGLLTLALPGLGQPSAEWRRVLAMLRAVPAAPGLGLGRAARLADIDQLAMHLLALASLRRKAREELASQTRIYDARAGTAIVRQGDRSDTAYFLLDGRTVASQVLDGAERVLEVQNAGDFFGEIAALTSVPRTASVIAEQPTTVLAVPATALRNMMSEPQINRVFLSKLTERMLRMQMVALPGFGGLDQETLRDLRTPDRQARPEAQLAQATT